MGITELHGVGPVIAERLNAAGVGTVEAIAGATTEELAAVPGVGQRLAARMQAEAQTMLQDGSPTGRRDSAPSSSSAATVAESVKGLHRAVPDLAKSKKHAKRLRKSTKRMTAWVDDLDQRKVRKQFLAETAKISDEAKKRTGSKKDAKALRKHAARIEKATVSQG
jgi:colicin import membrane protein